MTVTSSTNRASYSGNGTLTTFAYGFKIFDQDELTVILRSSTGVETVQTLTTNYTVTGVGAAGGGNVVFGTAPAAGVTIVVLRELDLEQGLNLVPNDPFPAESLESSLDKLTFMVQQHNEELGRTIKASRTNVLAGSEFAISAADRANKVFSFDGSGDLAVTQELGTFQGNWAASTVYKVRDLVKDTSTNNIFMVKTAHTSSGSQPITTNTDAAKWDLIVDAAAATTSASAAAASETAAETAETNAETAQAASEAAKDASVTAKDASVVAKDASVAAQAAAEAAYDSFDDRYLGAKSTSGGDPTVDNDGNALIDGALFFDTTNNVMKVYNLGTTAWLRTTPTSSDQTNINALSAAAVIADMAILATDAIVADMAILGTDAIVADMAILATDAIVADMAILATDAIVADMAILGTADVVNDMNILGTADVVTDMNVLATADVVTDMNVLATADVVNDMNVLGTSATVTAMNLLGTSAVVEDMGLLGTSTVISDMATLAGSEASPSVTNLTVSGLAALKELDLTAIATDITDTAVDVFVYDTSKDSDGGAWRHRTQATSWYNETLNTSTRGSRKEFPAVAVIVAESSQVTIYDGDDPDMPMWMVFNVASGNYLNIAGGSAFRVAMLNGIFSATGFRVAVVSFLADSGYLSEASYYNYSLKPISNRNSGSGTFGYNTTGKRIVNNTTNDVAMTVLPNAPIDAATGLPAVTVAVATDGGVSVIKDDGTVVDSSTTSAFGHIAINGTTLLYSFKSSNGACNYNRNIGSLVDGFSGSTYYGATTSNIPSLGVSNSLISEPEGLTDGSIAFSNSAHLTLLAENTTTPANGMVAYATSSYNTGWMNGDIKLATLSDTDATNVTGAELVTNGDGSSTTGWTAGDAASGLSVVSAKLRITNNDATPAWAYQGITTVVGTVYTATLTYTAGTLSGNPRMYLGNAAGSGGIGDLLSLTSTVPASTTFTATATTTYLTIDNTASANGVYADFDNISIRLAEEDRSVNGNGLQVFGTITKTAVATGADLVGYSGFSASNYLEQPYNADLDFGTGDFSVMGWFRAGNFGVILFHRQDENQSGNGFRVNQSANATLAFITSTGSSNTSVVTSPTITSGVWTNLCVIRSNGVINLYLNGTLEASGADSTNLTNTSAFLDVGTSTIYNAPAVGSSLALFRASATAPSPAQIAKIYEDEKFLFQENAGATLYGTSDAVTALAYDDTTDLLHAGTSAGRSVFQGLRRVDNTTDAVGAAISASNGLVAED